MNERINIKDLQEHFTKTMESTYILRSLQEEETKENKKRYFDVQLMDATGTIRGKIWEENMTEEHRELVGSIVAVKCLVIQSQTGACQLLIRSMEKAEGCEMSDYIKGLTEEECGRYMTMLTKYIQSIKHDGYRQLANAVYGGIRDLNGLPATLTGHHNYNGGFLVYTVSVTCLVNHILKSFSNYDRHPEHSVDFMPDILTTAALLHAVGTAGMLTPFPDCRRVEASIPLGNYDMTMRMVSDTAALHPEFRLTQEDISLLLHMIGCVYTEEERKPMLREAFILKKAVELQAGISMFDRFLAANVGREGIIYDDTLGNYLYIRPAKKEESNG